NILLAFGGSAEDFRGVVHEQKFFVDDPRLRSKDHQREMQSYTSIFREASAWVRGRDFTHVHFCEYDHVPLVRDLNQRQVERLGQEGADVMGCRTLRVDGSSHPHYLYHVFQPAFKELWRRLSRRGEGGVVLSMFVTGSVWTWEAFDAVAAIEEPFPMYLELYLPTLAHHLGFRVRDLSDQNRFVRNLGDLGADLGAARGAGAWAVHPVKHLWDRPVDPALLAAVGHR
ncbi:MAG: hypothetical protein ABMA01_11335, partial [Chthoniobacteraceae bacterium]